MAITDAWRFDAGVRYNHTQETRSGQEIDLTGPTPVVGDEETQRRDDSRWSGALGTSYRLWQDGHDYVTAYANYRDSFKPAAIDFGPEAEPDILEPETARSAELGLRGQQLDGRLQWDVSCFRDALQQPRRRRRTRRPAGPDQRRQRGFPGRRRRK